MRALLHGIFPLRLSTADCVKPVEALLRTHGNYFTFGAFPCSVQTQRTSAFNKAYGKDQETDQAKEVTSETPI